MVVVAFASAPVPVKQASQVLPEKLSAAVAVEYCWRCEVGWYARHGNPAVCLVVELDGSGFFVSDHVFSLGWS